MKVLSMYPPNTYMWPLTLATIASDRGIGADCLLVQLIILLVEESLSAIVIVAAALPTVYAELATSVSVTDSGPSTSVSSIGETTTFTDDCPAGIVMKLLIVP